MLLFGALLSLFCTLVCAYSAWINYQVGNTLWMWACIVLTVWNGLTLVSAASALIQ